MGFGVHDLHSSARSCSEAISLSADREAIYNAKWFTGVSILVIYIFNFENCAGKAVWVQRSKTLRDLFCRFMREYRYTCKFSPIGQSALDRQLILLSGKGPANLSRSLGRNNGNGVCIA